jgi:hypothetical protein
MVKYSGGSIMIWCYIMTHGPRLLRVVSGHMDQHQYLQILKECLPGVIRKYGMDEKNVIYQYDNDPKHKAKSVQQQLAEQGYNVMDGRLSYLILILLKISGLH